MSLPRPLRWFLVGSVLLSQCLVAAVARADGPPSDGLGLQVAPLSSGEVVVLAVIEGSPAEQADMRPGDVILVINDTPLAGRDFRMNAREFFWNETVRAFRIVYARPGVTGVQSLTLTREPLTGEPRALPGIDMLTPDRPLPAEGKP